MNTKKAEPQENTPVKISKLNDIFSQYLSQIFNGSTEAANFPNVLKYADITPVYKSHVMLTTDKKKINVKGSLISNEKIVKFRSNCRKTPCHC